MSTFQLILSINIFQENSILRRMFNYLMEWNNFDQMEDAAERIFVISTTDI